MCGPQIQLCLFTFRPIASKELNSLTKVDTFSRLGGQEKTHPTRVRDVSCSIPGSGKDFVYVWIWVLLLLCFYLFCQKHIICRDVLQFLL